MTSLTTPSGQAVSYGYNGNHQVTSVAVNGATVLNSVSYEPIGPVSGWTWGNGSTTTRTYDTDGKISQIVSAGTKTYSYDDAFRITGTTDTGAGAANWTYGYDALDRITSGTSPSITRGWTYDANGNRLTEGGTAASAYSISPTNNRITAVTGALTRTYSYDAAGNMTSYSTVSATYNNAGRLKTLTNGATTETSVYNALGQRIEVSGGAAGTVLYVYDEAGHLLGEYDGTGTLIQETVWLGDIPVATLRPNGTTVSIYYVHTDQLNTPRQVTRSSDNVAMWTWFSDPFGTDAANANPAGAGAFAYNIRFPGQIFDGEAGLHQNGYREYDPALGGYIESDPIGLSGRINTYRYGVNNPLAFFDSSGLSAEDVEAIRHHIDQNFPEIHTHGGWEFGDPGPDNLAQASIWSGRITVDNYFMRECLTHDDFVALYFEVLHESMHSTDSPDQRWWDWFREPTLSANHRRIVNRARYEEGMNPNGTAPFGGMWGHTDEAPSPPIWPQVDRLYTETRSCACKQ
jgi:RHS repeat-associated protein